MKKIIDLEELFDNNFDCYTELLIQWEEIEKPAMTKEKFKIVIVDVANELLKLAAENIVIKDSIDVDMFTLKSSILDTINQVV